MSTGNRLWALPDEARDRAEEVQSQTAYVQEVVEEEPRVAHPELMKIAAARLRGQKLPKIILTPFFSSDPFFLLFY